MVESLSQVALILKGEIDISVKSSCRDAHLVPCAHSVESL